MATDLRSEDRGNWPNRHALDVAFESHRELVRRVKDNDAKALKASQKVIEILDAQTKILERAIKRINDLESGFNMLLECGKRIQED